MLAPTKSLLLKSPQGGLGGQLKELARLESPFNRAVDVVDGG